MILAYIAWRMMSIKRGAKKSGAKRPKEEEITMETKQLMFEGLATD
jgi:threonine/homoserine/homoserine lactone efflux protein